CGTRSDHSTAVPSANRWITRKRSGPAPSGRRSTSIGNTAYPSPVRAPPSQVTDAAIAVTGAPAVAGAVGTGVDSVVPTRAVHPAGATGATPTSGRAVGRNTSSPVVGTAGSSLVTRKVIVTSRAPDSARDAA